MLLTSILIESGPSFFGQQSGWSRRVAYRRQLEHMAGRGNGVLPAAWYLARNFTSVLLTELGSTAGET